MEKSKIKISVITPTIRPEGLSIVAKALSKQTFRDFEWIVITPIKKKTEVIDSGINTIYVKDPGKKNGDVWSLNKAYNAGIKKAKGKLLISWQDWTSAGPNTLEEFWKHYEEEPNTLVSAVGNKYENDNWDVMIWKDPRIRDDMESFYPCYFQDIEWNLCSIPKQAVYDVGGFDESLDRAYGLDAFSVDERIWELGGYDFKLDQSIKSYSLPHGRYSDWDDKNAMNGKYEEIRREHEEKGEWPVLKYLK
jgi:glycosyltransferase involved in cell wall biosynthesis